MDPEDLALLAQLTGRGSAQADPTPPSDSQLMAEILARNIAANPLPGRPAAPPIDPQQTRQDQPAEFLGNDDRPRQADRTGVPEGDVAPSSTASQPWSAPGDPGGGAASPVNDGVYRPLAGGPGNDAELSLVSKRYPVTRIAGPGSPSNLIRDSDNVAGSALRVTSALNSKWMYGNLDTATAQSAFDRANAAIDRTAGILENSKDPEAQAAIERLNNAGYQLATQAREAGLRNINSQSIRRALEDAMKDAGKDAMASAFGEQFGD